MNLGGTDPELPDRVSLAVWVVLQLAVRERLYNHAIDLGIDNIPSG